MGRAGTIREDREKEWGKIDCGALAQKELGGRGLTAHSAS